MVSGVGDADVVWGGVVDWVRAYGGWLAVGLLLLVVAGWVGYRWWRRRIAAALRERLAVNLVPSASFEPSEDEVDWFAGQLGQVREAAGAQPRRGSAVRVRLVCERGELVYRVEGPMRAASLLRMASFSGVEVVEPGAGAFEVPRIRFEGAPPVPAARTGSGVR